MHEFRLPVRLSITTGCTARRKAGLLPVAVRGPSGSYRRVRCPRAQATVGVWRTLGRTVSPSENLR